MLKKEQIEQINFMHWLSHHYPDVYEDTYHFANERKCSAFHGNILKRMGVKAGVADLFIAIPKGNYSGLWIELKVEKNKATKFQLAFLNRMKKRGYEAKLATGIDEAKLFLLQYLNQN